MPTIKAELALEHSCPFNGFNACLGSRCMAWAWVGPTVETKETDNLVETDDGLRPSGEPSIPEGDGWEADGPPYSKGYHRSAKDSLPKATAQRWVRQRALTQGMCGRSMPDQTHQYW